MAEPASRENLKQYALRALGKPVIEINADDDTDITLGDYDLKKVGAALNFPISDKLATKLTISSIQRDGFTQ